MDFSTDFGMPVALDNKFLTDSMEGTDLAQKGVVVPVAFLFPTDSGDCRRGNCDSRLPMVFISSQSTQIVR